MSSAIFARYVRARSQKCTVGNISHSVRSAPALHIKTYTDNLLACDTLET